MLSGNVKKTGAGVFETNHFRVAILTIGESGGTLSAGTLRVLQEGTTIFAGTLNTSRVGEVAVHNGQLDLMNNAMIIDYTGGTPIPTGASSTSALVADLAEGYASGSWNGNGIMSTFAQSGTYKRGIGYAEETSLSVGTFAGMTLDSTSVAMKLTLLGDSNLNETVNITDFGLLASNFNETDQYWYDGDYNYDTVVNITDFGLQSANFNVTLNRGGNLPPRADLFIEMLKYPLVYWSVRESEYWELYFPGYDLMNLATIPARPADMEARSVPEPAAVSAIFAAALFWRRRA